MSIIANGKKVTLEYTLRLEDEAVISSNVGGDPLTYVHGDQQIVPGLEEALEGLSVGDSKQVTVAPEKGYGAVNPEEFQEAPKDQIPPDAQKVGAQLQATFPDGRQAFPRVAEVRPETVLLDFNHPLAGRTLRFDVTVMDVQ